MISTRSISSLLFFFFNDTATTEIYTLSLHDALPICPDPRGQGRARHRRLERHRARHRAGMRGGRRDGDRKSTRLNSSHSQISYAVFCLKKKKRKTEQVYKVSTMCVKSEETR